MKVLSKNSLAALLLSTPLVCFAQQETNFIVEDIKLKSSEALLKAGLSIRKKDFSDTIIPALLENSVVLSDRTLEPSMPFLGEAQVKLSLQSRTSKKLSGKHPLVRLRDSLNLNYQFTDLDVVAQLNIRKRRFTVQYSDHLKFEINDIGKESQFASVRYEVKF